jgi:primosomal protein N' (replication factor Y)
MRLVADVAVPVPFARALSYEVPRSMAAAIRPGSRVLCEVRRRKILGVVLSVQEGESYLAGKRLKPLSALVDPEPAIPAELLAFLRELADYYVAPIGEVLRLALPAIERERLEGIKPEGELFALERVEGARAVGGRRVAFVRPTDTVEAAGSLRGQAAAILARLRATGGEPVARLEERFGNARAAVKKLAGLGLVAVEQREEERDPFFAEAEARDTPPELTDAQRAAAARVEAALVADPPRGAAFLLFGVTGSGKTEVYLRAIAATLARGRGALVMVPEIALTPQLVARFRARFGDEVAVLHSALAERDRHAMWTRLRRGELRVAIGARSALFAPVPDLGLVVVDEEHDSSFKQEEGVRYHARDMALLRAHRARAVAVLGSATPSLEAVALSRAGKVEELRLPDRAHAEAKLPAVTIVDLKRIGAGPTGDRLVSLPLYRAIEQTLAAGEQAILFLNRRGFAPSVVCDACGVIETCRACSVALTFHRGARPEAGRLRCHYCDYERPLGACSSCNAPALSLEGLGTERLEATIAAAFPAARVARLDRDVTGGERSEAVMKRMRDGEIDVLVGTQMVTKGHDLPRVTLVGVVNADAALSMPDFRAAERGFSLLVQVAGRAGRHDRPGRVLIQTRAPSHPAIVFAARHDVPSFLEHELSDRREVGYPPYARLALLRVDAIDEGIARAAAAQLAAEARTTPEVLGRLVEVLGPAAAPIARLRGRYRFRVLLRARDRRPLRAVLAEAARARDHVDRRARVAIDVDPVSML